MRANRLFSVAVFVFLRDFFLCGGWVFLLGFLEKSGARRGVFVVKVW
jgi:hypothetical protein